MTDLDDLLERFRRGAELVAATASGITGSEADFRPTPGQWSARQIIAHLADMELVSAHRLRRTLAEDRPLLTAFDHHQWAQALAYADSRLSERLELLRTVRTANFELLRALPVDSFHRPAELSDHGSVTLTSLLRLITEHTEQHARQIEHNREKYRDHRPR